MPLGHVTELVQGHEASFLRVPKHGAPQHDDGAAGRVTAGASVRPLHLRWREPLTTGGGAYQLLYLGFGARPNPHVVTKLIPTFTDLRSGRA